MHSFITRRPTALAGLFFFVRPNVTKTILSDVNRFDSPIEGVAWLMAVAIPVPAVVRV